MTCPARKTWKVKLWQHHARKGNTAPDQDRIDEIGEALGITYEDDEPLGGEDKLRGRDRRLDRDETDTTESESGSGRKAKQ